MIELELLGLHPDGDRLSLNDPEGNRYILPITEDLRAALRTDLTDQAPSEEPKRITPREIQAHFRAGLSVAEVSEISAMPPSQLEGLAHPIFAERQYTAELARTFRQGKEVGGMTLEELVVSRLVPREVSATDIDWDAYRDAGKPWTLVAKYTTKDQTHTALWRVNMKAQAVEALNDEATWLTETQIPAPTSPWRPLNTPVMDSAEADSQKVSILDAKPASAGKPTTIDAMLSDLDLQRGKARPMPIDEEEEFDGAHPAASEPERATDATVLSLADRRKKDVEADEESAETAKAEDIDDSATEEGVPEADSQNEAPVDDTESDDDDADEGELPGQQRFKLGEAGESTRKRTKKRRKDRPSMPSWDEIVFGYSKDD